MFDNSASSVHFPLADPLLPFLLNSSPVLALSDPPSTVPRPPRRPTANDNPPSLSPTRLAHLRRPRTRRSLPPSSARPPTLPLPNSLRSSFRPRPTQESASSTLRPVTTPPTRRRTSSSHGSGPWMRALSLESESQRVERRVAVEESADRGARASRKGRRASGAGGWSTAEPSHDRIRPSDPSCLTLPSSVLPIASPRPPRPLYSRLHFPVVAYLHACHTPPLHLHTHHAPHAL